MGNVAAAAVSGISAWSVHGAGMADKSTLGGHWVIAMCLTADTGDSGLIWRGPRSLIERSLIEGR